MPRLIEKSKYIALIAIVSMLVAATAAFIWGAYKTYLALALMVTSTGKDPLITFYLIQLVDVFLIAIVLYLLSASVFELFIGELALPG